MKKNDVKIGDVYTAKVTDKVVPVRIDAVKGTGWSATNLATGKTIYIKSAQRLRGKYRGKTDVPKADQKNARPADKGTLGTTSNDNQPKATSLPQKATGSPTSATGAKATKDAKPSKAATRAKQGTTKAKRPSGLDAAAKILGESKKPMTVREIVKMAFEKKYWKSDGKTPSATIYSAMIREVAAKGKESRFKKVGRGKFTLNG